jgi:hypothetical protein
MTKIGNITKITTVAESSFQSSPSLNNQVYCRPAPYQSNVRKRSVCKDRKCISQGCLRPEDDANVNESDCDSCEVVTNLIDNEVDSDDSSLEETIETINEVLDLKPSNNTARRPRKLAPRKVTRQIKDADALKAFAFGIFIN